MMSVWLYRPQFTHLGLYIAAYLLGCGFAQSLAVVPGTSIAIWPSAGLFLATLVIAPRQSWLWWMMAGCLAELAGNILWFHRPLPAAVLIYIGNASAAAAGAWIVGRMCERPGRLETVKDVLIFVFLGAGAASVISATIGSATLASFGMQSQTFAAAWPLWWIGDTTGVLMIAPLALALNWRGQTSFSAGQWAEAFALGLIFIVVVVLSMSVYLPFAYIIMPPLLWAAMRFEMRGSAVALILLALVTMIFTVSGATQFASELDTRKYQQIMLQLFLVISAFSALVVSALSQQHQQAIVSLRRNVEALRGRERELSHLVDMVPIHIRRLTKEGEPTFFNKRLIDFFGLDIVDLDKPGTARMAAAITKLVHPDDAARLVATVRQSIATGEPYSMKYRMRRADGAYRWVDGRAEPLRDEAGEIVQWYAISIDVDDEMRAQEALRDREQELSQLVDMVPSLIWRLSPDGEPIFFNKQMADFLGMTVAEAGRPGTSRLQAVIEAVHPDDEPHFRETLHQRLVTGESFAMNYRLRHADGTYRWMSGRAEPMRDDDGSIVQWFGLSHDIDDQMRLFSEVEEREARIRRLVDSDVIGIVIWDLDGRLIDANNAFLRMLQYEPADLQAGLRWFDMTPPEWQEAHSEYEAEELRTTGKMQPREKEYFRKDGTRVPVLIGAACFEGRSGQGVAYILDLTELKRAEAALRDRERELAQLVDTVPTQIWATTGDGQLSYMNKRLTDYVGLTLTEIDPSEPGRLQTAMKSTVHPDDYAAVRLALEHSFNTSVAFVMRYRLHRADGVHRWVECRAEPLRDPDGHIVKWYGVIIDIDDEVNAHEELRRTLGRLAASSHAASLAELSASIAHEVNQPLAAIVANSHACHRWLTADPPNLDRAKITAERIIRDANSAADVVSRIRALFKQAAEPRDCTNLSSVICEARDLMAEEAVRQHVRIDVQVGDNLPLVTIDRVQIQQVVLNLMRNGMEAMISTSGERVLGVRVQRVEDVVQTEINDRGPGVEFPDKIFQPFFTTKEQGMGMGLAICRSIVDSHGGRLWMGDNLPQGAAFTFTLPVAVEATHDAR